MPNKKRNRNNAISGQRIDDDLNVNLSKNAMRRNKRKNKKIENDTPREFLRILKYKEILENKKKAKQNKNKENPKKNTENELKIQKGESLSAFSKRVEDECRISILKAQTVDTKKKQKRKNYLINKKLKKMNKLKKDEGLSFEDLKDNVKFGEQAYEPPTINVVPKKRKSNNNNSSNENNTKTIDNNEKDNNENKKLSKPKLKTLSLIERKHIIDEREKVIANYRKIKQRKLQQYNPFEAEKDEFEYDPNDFL
ncbi:hypothetical protein BCR36DRAFT_320856 [Piromyces finnis]|uniref:Uncharacterized protein n=1 Tax=Piromyces finnis TaxID=1754191 RepID=A0A1Y1VH35_9FUNG|nr:hypothetical protein BCR36DRAFT_320856 [Piromyces finnis]|eukprot:ORX56047.1 hypothetical protein BCR36DRAFT_320856 [Piromyces finnis]